MQRLIVEIRFEKNEFYERKKDRKRNVKVKLVYRYKDKNWRFVMTIVISDCLYSQKLEAFLENSGL